MQAQSYVNQTDEPNWQSNWTYNAITSLLLDGTFVRKTTALEKSADMYWLPFSFSATTSADAFWVTFGRTISYLLHDASYEKNQISQERNPPKFPQYPIL